jgi:glycosyltransferase involved in cell wall biosynthesis
MNILLLAAYFPPDTGSAAHLFYELGTALVKKGHGVTILTSFPSYHARGDLGANLITVHSPGNRDHVVMNGASPGKVEVMLNWVDTDFIAHEERINGFREEYNLGNKFVVSFAAVIGYSQDIDVILNLRDGVSLMTGRLTSLKNTGHT